MMKLLLTLVWLGLCACGSLASLGSASEISYAESETQQLLSRERRANSKEDPKLGFGFRFPFVDVDKTSGSGASIPPFFSAFFYPFRNPFSNIEQKVYNNNNNINEWDNRWTPGPGRVFGNGPPTSGPIMQQAPIFDLSLKSGWLMSSSAYGINPASQAGSRLHVPQAGGAVYGNPLPPTTPSKRVRRASSSDPSSSDVISFGDFSIPKDTFNKMLERDRVKYESIGRGPPGPSENEGFGNSPPPQYPHTLPRDPHNYTPSSHYPPQPMQYPPQTSPYVQPPPMAYQQQQQANYNRVYLQNLIRSGRITLQQAQKMIYGQRFGVPAWQTPYYPPAPQIKPPMGLPLPMGSAQPLFGNHPVYI